MSRHSRVAQDVLAHFALREAKVGSSFEKKGFWRLELAKEQITHEILGAALGELVDQGFVVQSGHDHFLTQKGHEHLYGRKETEEARPKDREQEGE